MPKMHSFSLVVTKIKTQASDSSDTDAAVVVCLPLSFCLCLFQSPTLPLIALDKLAHWLYSWTFPLIYAKMEITLLYKAARRI